MSADSSPFFGSGLTLRLASSHASISVSLCTFASNSLLTVSWLGGMGTIWYSSRTSLHLPFTLCSYGTQSLNSLTYSHTRSNLV